MYVGMCDNHFVSDFVLSLEVKNFENRLIFREVIDMSRVSCVFDSQCIHYHVARMTYLTWVWRGGINPFIPLCLYIASPYIGYFYFLK